MIQHCLNVLIKAINNDAPNIETRKNVHNPFAGQESDTNCGRKIEDFEAGER